MASGVDSRNNSPRPASHSHRQANERDNHRHRRHHHHHHHAHDRKRKRTPPPTIPAVLPLGARPLSKHDLSTMRPILASYMDIQKQLFMEDLTEYEIKGRWKSFVSKWNHGQLAEGWYDPTTKQKAIDSFAESQAQQRPDPQHQPLQPTSTADLEEEEDEYGPVLPQLRSARGPASRPMAPDFSELALRADQAAEEADSRRETLRHERKLDRLEQRERLDELAPRAEPGTKERQLEKNKEKAAAVKAFGDAKSGAGDMQEIPESELLGGEGGGTDDVKRMKKEMERKRTEREQRKLEILQARAVEREERLQAHRAKENQTMEMLHAIAKERFG